jgi:phosphatidylserine decarboxylase
MSLDHLKAAPLYLLPHHALSRLMLAVTRIRNRPFKNLFIRWFANHFQVDLSEAREQDIGAYENFNHFFTRALKPDARPLPQGLHDICCPVDGHVSQIGDIEDARLLQAKGHDYSLQQLLGGSEQDTALFRNGRFATIYLSPRDYHRIHMPLDGRLRRMVHVPGRLFSVASHCVNTVPGLFARNERVVALFETEAGPMALILVGAIFVAAIETVWAGLVTPPRGRSISQWDYPADGPDSIELKRGEEMGRFNMGSTVIVLFGRQAVEWEASLEAESPVQMGQKLGKTAAN